MLKSDGKETFAQNFKTGIKKESSAFPLLYTLLGQWAH